jgi:hypothetical protein
MNRFLIVVVLAIVCAAGSSVSAADDPVGSLIDNEQAQQQAWLDEPHDVPDVFLWGDDNGVEIDDPRAVGNDAALCRDIQYDQWLAFANAEVSKSSVKLNIALPRLREALGSSCVVRPTDHVLAVGKGWQKEISLDVFTIRRGIAACISEFPYSLWGEPAEELPATPLFYTTNLEFGEVDNHFTPPKWAPIKNKTGDEARDLRAAIPELDDYTVLVSEVGAPNVDALYFLERRTVSPDDDDLPNQILASCKSGRCQSLWIERVNQKSGTGHINVTGTLDFNGDGKPDLMLEGDHAKCPYRKIFIGTDEGFTLAETPELACGC